MSDYKGCEAIEESIPLILRDGAEQVLSAADLAHSKECQDCVALLSALRGVTPLFAVPEPVECPEALVQNTLDRCLVILPAGAEEQVGQAADFVDKSAFRSSMQALTRLPLDDGASRMTRGRLFLRFCTQIAAALLVCVTCICFWDIYRPAYAEARAASSHDQCQVKLRFLYDAAKRYQSAVPNKKPLRGAELRRALVKYGYVDPSDFHCPSLPATSLRTVHFDGFLPPASEQRPCPVFWDKFNNHANSVNVIFSNGTIARISSHHLVDLYLNMNLKRSG